MRVLTSVIKILVFDSVNEPVIQMFEMVCWGEPRVMRQGKS